MQDEELVRLFSDDAANPELADAVTAVRVVRDRATNVGKGVAYVEVCAAQKILTCMSGEVGTSSSGSRMLPPSFQRCIGTTLLPNQALTAISGDHMASERSGLQVP